MGRVIDYWLFYLSFISTYVYNLSVLVYSSSLSNQTQTEYWLMGGVKGLTCLVHQSLYSGLELVVMPAFSLDRFCSHIQTYHITFAYVVPPVVLMLGKSPIVSNYDLSSIRMMNSGAAPLTREIVDAVYKRLKIPIKQGYGLS